MIDYCEVVGWDFRPCLVDIFELRPSLLLLWMELWAEGGNQPHQLPMPRRLGPFESHSQLGATLDRRLEGLRDVGLVEMFASSDTSYSIFMPDPEQVIQERGLEAPLTLARKPEILPEGEIEMHPALNRFGLSPGDIWFITYFWNRVGRQPGMLEIDYLEAKRVCRDITQPSALDERIEFLISRGYFKRVYREGRGPILRLLNPTQVKQQRDDLLSRQYENSRLTARLTGGPHTQFKVRLNEADRWPSILKLPLSTAQWQRHFGEIVHPLDESVADQSGYLAVYLLSGPGQYRFDRLEEDQERTELLVESREVRDQRQLQFDFVKYCFRRADVDWETGRVASE